MQINLMENFFKDSIKVTRNQLLLMTLITCMKKDPSELAVHFEKLGVFFIKSSTNMLYI